MTSMQRYKLHPAAWPRRSPSWVALAVAVATAVGLVVPADPARAQLKVDITRPVVEPLPIAITELFGEITDEQKLGADIARVVAANLERSGLFRPVDKGAFIQDARSLRNGPRYGDWRLINAQALVAGNIQLRLTGACRCSSGSGTCSPRPR